MTGSLGGRALFLSASFPSGERGQRFRPYDPAEIADAVTAISRAVLAAGGRLVFGAHPTITPLVLFVASEHERKRSVDVFQSRWFERQIPQETRRLQELGFGEIHWTDKAKSEVDSLRLMRVEMLRRTDPVAGVFVGGMEGIVDEWNLFGELLEGRMRIPVLRPGGAAATLAKETRLPDRLGSMLRTARYPVLASGIVDYLIQA